VKYLVDIGNSFAHIYDGKTVKHLPHKEFLEQFNDKELFFINVNPKLKTILEKNPLWKNIASFYTLEGAYESMGIDRQVLLAARGDGIYIDAGSAITIDKKLNGSFVGGVILPGIWKVKQFFAQISSALTLDELAPLNLEELPKSDTKETLSFGIIAPIVALVEKINKEQLPIFLTGGDGTVLAQYLNAHYEPTLLFEGMQNIIAKEVKL
jgi:type III pantothenate kinase